jgi:dTDP-glucose pyrophosphorylase
MASSIKINAKLSISHPFFCMKNLQYAGIDNVFFWINHVEKCTHQHGDGSTQRNINMPYQARSMKHGLNMAPVVA